MFQDPENIGTMYPPGDRHAAAFEDRGDHEIEVEPIPPDGAVHYRGFMLSTEQARFVGLL
jgi:hypothetical protein